MSSTIAEETFAILSEVRRTADVGKGKALLSNVVQNIRDLGYLGPNAVNRRLAGVDEVTTKTAMDGVADGLKDLLDSGIRHDRDVAEGRSGGRRRRKKTRKTRRRRRGGSYKRTAIQEILQVLRGALLSSASLDQRKNSLRQGLLLMEPVVGPNPARITPAEISALTTISAVEDASAALRRELYASSAYQESGAPTLNDPEHPGPDGPSAPLTVNARAPLGPSPRRPRVNTDPGIESPPSSPRGGRRRTTRRRS